MCKKLDLLEENDSAKEKKPIASDAVLFFQHEQIHEEIDDIHEKEKKQQITDFLKGNKKVGENMNLTFEEIAHCLTRHVEEMEELDSSYSLWDETATDINTIIAAYQKNERNRKKEKSAVEEKSTAINLKEYILKEKQTGKTNLQIIEAILEKETMGKLQVPKEKIAQYKKLLTLANYSEATTDKVHIHEIINLSENVLLDEGSFENIVLSIYEDVRISESTKVQIQQQFNIKPIQTGGDLRNALNHRNQTVQEHEQQQETLNQKLKELANQEENLDKKVHDLQAKLEFSSNSKEREELSQEIQELGEELQRVKKEQESINVDSYVLKQKKPIKEIYLRGYKARLDEDIISIENPLKSGSISIPIEANDKEIGEIANTLFLYQTLKNLGGAKLIFPDEKFGAAHLPSASMIRFSNEILAALNLGHSGAILSKDELNELTLRMKQLQNPENLNYAKSKADAFKEDLQELGLVEGDILIKHQFLNLLESISAQEDNYGTLAFWSKEK